MAPRNDGLSLEPTLIRKGEARGQSPAQAPPPPPPPVEALRQAAVLEPPSAPAAPQEPSGRGREGEGRGIKPIPPSDLPKRFTSFRLPVDLDEALRDMVYQTRRPKQELLIEFVTDGVAKWRRGLERAGQGG